MHCGHGTPRSVAGDEILSSSERIHILKLCARVDTAGDVSGQISGKTVKTEPRGRAFVWIVNVGVPHEHVGPDKSGVRRQRLVDVPGG